MAGEIETIFSSSGRMHVLLRRETRCIVDVEWMAVNVEYVREIMKISLATENAELCELVQRIETLHPLLIRANNAKSPPHRETESEPVAK
jgi:hypothetical protein